MLMTGSHSLRSFSLYDEGVYLIYMTEEQDEKRPRNAKLRLHEQAPYFFQIFRNINEISD